MVLSVFGAIVGIQLLASLGITPNTSLIGALAAMALARIPLAMFRGFRSVHSQNLAQTSISSATFGAANSLFLPIGIPFLFGLPDMVLPMLVGVSLAMLLDAWLLYRMFDTPAFPARSPWPPGRSRPATAAASRPSCCWAAWPPASPARCSRCPCRRSAWPSSAGWAR